MRGNKTCCFRFFVAAGILGLLCACAKVEPSDWHEDFDVVGKWQLSSDAVAQTSIENGELSIRVLEPGQVAWVSHEGEWDNFELTVDARMVSGPVDNEYGVLVRMENDARFYAFSVSSDGYVRAAFYEDGLWTVMGSDWTEHPAVKLGEASNTIVVIAQDTECTFQVNGETALTVTDLNLSRGGIGLYAGAFTEGDVVISFDHLTLHPLP